ncbi:hypothetical protein EJ04DRAFT_569078 [Polyplosphaeria fusca]|uniref:Uncharacterized protein n=1 Tax=Polyplosphaeria fusca TaxID=682080 RepID=A0A9P4UUJ0_9PLEO|nr:hypothetical protein EJ04DRAFT_569078 [Polyplosphaeria fusca]
MDVSPPGTARPHVEINTGPTFFELLDQHQATSHLLEQQHHQAEDAIPSNQHGLKGDVDDVPSLGGSDVPSDKLDGAIKSPTIVSWKGPPFYSLTGELLGIVISSLFFTLGICVAQLENQVESPWSSAVIQATRVAPSIWPIMFSGVLGTAIRALADWQVERGVSLLALEQLLGSLTMASSVITMFRWSILRISSVALILLWAFNPLGSQASLRGAYLQSKTGFSQGLIQFFENNLSKQILVSAFSDLNNNPGNVPPIVPSLYTSALHDLISGLQYVDLTVSAAAQRVANLGGESSAGIQAATDSWGNIRIPNLKYLTNYDPSHPNDWLNTTWDKKILNYSSLIGDRIEGVNHGFTGNTTFVIPSSYLDISCSPWFYLNNSNTSLNRGGPASSPADKWLSDNTGNNLAITFSLNKDSNHSVFRPITISTIKRNASSDPDQATATEFVFGQYRSPHLPVTLTRCTPRTMYVDANVTCISKGTLGKASCGVNALRESKQPLASPNQTIFDNDLYSNDGDVSNSFRDVLLDGTSDESLEMVSTVPYVSSNAEFFLVNPLTVFTASRNGVPGRFSKDDDLADLGHLDIELFERRLSLLLNTVWKAGWLKQTTVGGEMKLIDNGRFKIDMVKDTPSSVIFPLPQTYGISRPWLAVYFLAVVAMFLAAFVSLVLRTACYAPSILGYASSLTRDSTYFEGYDMYKNSTEDGPTKSKRLGGLRVMVADVGSGAEGIGKIALVPVGMGKRVRMRRMYI